MKSAHSIQDYLDIIRQGIEKKFGSGKPKKVIIVGAGLAGLTAGYELKRAGHSPIILEAQQRVGGRVYTLRDPFTDGLYAEVGAMRIPRAHTLTMEYIEKFRLPVNDFTMDNPNAYYFIGGRKMRSSEATADPHLLGFDVSPQEQGCTAGQLWLRTIQPLLSALEKDGAHVLASLHLGQLYLQQADIARAKPYLQRASSLAGDSQAGEIARRLLKQYFGE